MGRITVDLRCHSCSHVVGSALVAMECVGLFKASLLARVERSARDETRKRCKSCGWVNIFHPVIVNQRTRNIEVKV